jgi:hypothetical protein
LAKTPKKEKGLRPMSKLHLTGIVALVFLAPIVFVIVQHRDNLSTGSGHDTTRSSGELLFFTAPG